MKRDDENSCSMYFKPKVRADLIVHEITHVLRYLCVDRYMLFDDESEHMAYISQYLFNRINGLTYKKPK